MKLRVVDGRDDIIIIIIIIIIVVVKFLSKQEAWRSKLV